MSVLIKTCAASLALVASFAALAADAPPAATPPADADTPAVQVPLGQMAVRDAATGRLRAPTAVEAETLHAAGAKSLRTLARGPETLTRYHQSGATGVRLSESFMSYSMVVKQPDGRLTEYCFESREAAEAALAAPTAAPVNNSLPTE